MSPAARSHARNERTASGFTLLEVLVAVAILGLGLTVILSSQVGLFSSSQRAENLSLATHMARCRMNETEVELLKNGYPQIDQNDDGPCCEEESESRFRCSRKIERIELPQPAGLESSAADGGAADPGGGMGPLGALASVQQSGGAVLGGDGGIGALSSLMGGGTAGGMAGGAQAMAPIVMGLVYPDLKPMLEASIRKLTIVVHWKEGKHERDLSVTQYVTNPQQGGFDPNAAEALKAADMLGTGSSATPGNATGVGAPAGPGASGAGTQ